MPLRNPRPERQGAVILLGFFALTAGVVLISLVSSSAGPEETVLDIDGPAFQDWTPHTSNHHVSFGPANGAHDKVSQAAHAKLEKDAQLVDLAKIKLSSSAKSKIKRAKDKAALKMLGISGDHTVVTRLSRHTRQAFTNGELQEREHEISQRLHEKNKEKAKQMEAQARLAELKKIRAETSKDISQIHSDKEGEAEADDDDDDEQLSDSDSFDSYKSAENRIRARLRTKTSAHARQVAEQLREHNEKIIQAIKRDSKDVGRQVQDTLKTAGAENHEEYF